MTVCVYFHEFNGTVMTTYDCYCLLKKYIPDLKCLFILSDTKTIMPFISYFKDVKFILQNDISTYKDDIIICSAYFFHSAVQHFTHLTLHADKIIIFDSACLIRDSINNTGTAKLIKSLPNYTVLGNEFNQQFFDPQYYVLFPAPMNFERLDKYKIKIHSVYKVNTLQRRKHLSPLEYAGYSYHRHEHINGLYFENIGRTFFEYIYMGRPVQYSPKNKSIDDGLTYYLNKLGIDDNKKHYITDMSNKVQEVFNFDYDKFLTVCNQP